MKNILLATDFSENSANAVEFALDLFAGHSCTFYLLYISTTPESVHDDLLSATPQDTVYDSLVDRRKEKSKACVANLQKRYVGERFQIKAISGYSIFPEAVQQLIFLKQIDLVVIGTEGVRGARQAVLGSHTRKVIRNAKCPVLVVPNRCHFKEIENFLYTVDYGEAYKPAKLAVVFDLFKKKKMKLTVFKMEDQLKSQEEEEKERKKTEETFSNLVCSYYSICEVDTSEAVNGLLQVMPVDLNVLEAKRELFLGKKFSKSTVSGIISSSKIPLLILPESN